MSKFMRTMAAAGAMLGAVAVGSAPALAQDTIKVGVLHSLSGTMAISETTLKDTVLMMVDDINKKHGRRVLYIEPVGEAVVRLREMIVAGKFPGITQQSKLFRDAIGHGKGHVMALASYCNYAVIYGRSPAGLNVEE